MPPERAETLGREATIADLLEALAAADRLVGLVGPGGVGKTTTALSVAHRVPGHWWVAFVDLAACRTQRHLVNAVAAASGVDLQPADVDRQEAQLVRALGMRDDGLLILDNLEQLGCAPESLLRAFGAAGRALRVLATSRHRLARAPMRWIEIAPLPTDDAVRLFVRRAQAIGYAGPIDDVAARRIVAQLDALPAAIELAATRLSLMTPAELATRLERDLLGTLRGKPGTIDDVIARSWQLLEGSLREVLAACAVFREGFTLEALEAVLADAPGVIVRGASPPRHPPGTRLMEIRSSVETDSQRSSKERTSMSLASLGLLRDSSVLALTRSGEAGGTSRLAMNQCLRAYVLERLPARRRAALEARHAEHFARCAARWCAEGAPTIREVIGAEQANLWAAFDRLRSTRPEDAMRVALALERYLNVRGTPAGHLALMERAVRLHRDVNRSLGAEILLALARAERRAGRLEAAYATLARARALAPSRSRLHAAIEQLTGRVLIIMGRGEEARRHYGLARREAERSGDRVTLMRTIRDFAELDASVEGAEEALRLATTEGDLAEEAFAHWVLARQCRGQRRFAEAISHLDAALARARSAGECYLEALVLASSGRAHQHAGEPDASLPPYAEALALQRQSGNEAMARWVEIDLATAEHELGRVDAARERLGRALAACRDAGDRRMEVLALAHLALVELVDRPDDARATLLRAAQRGRDLPDPNLQAMAVAAGLVAARLADPANTLDFDEALARSLAGSDRDVAVIVFARIAHRLLDTPTDLVVAPSSGWYETARGRVAVGRESPLMRVLLELVRAHALRSTRAVPRGALVRAGWPGERISASAATNRLRNAVARLRGAGLQDALLTQSGGYLLRPDVVVRVEVR